MSSGRYDKPNFSYLYKRMKTLISTAFVCFAIAVFSSFLGISCGPSKAEGSGEIVAEISRQDFVEEVLEVDTATILYGPFSKELISNGKLEARKASKLQLQLNEEIREIRVKNGQYVRKGDTLAVLRNFPLKNAVSIRLVLRVLRQNWKCGMP